MHRGQPAEVNVVSEGEGHVGIGSGTGRPKKKNIGYHVVCRRPRYRKMAA